MNQNQYHSYKLPDVNPLHECYLSPFLNIVFGVFVAYANQHNLPVISTSLMDDAPGRVSKTHSDGRARDISGKGWSLLHRKAIELELNTKFRKWGTSADGNNPRVIIWHDTGSGLHAHLQVRRGASLSDIEWFRIKY